MIYSIQYYLQSIYDPGDRGRVVERSLNRRTNEEERKQDFINMDENDAPSFDNEWNHRTRTAMHSLGDVRKDTRRALEEPRKRHDRGRGRLENREERGHHRAFAPDHAEPDNYRGRGDEYRRRDEDYRGYREDRREHGEDYRGRGREKARDHERKVRVNSRPTNKHQPRGSLD
ncbi:predicted protein [Nematostella vectensis]|uniref:Uncharacterized protein n=1 Tax=Nematostella vectensis TaxID=45351 RepID=A7SMH3_NEMVE|nr:predicted protein [Nematostella vectensis]|eukprot:XP_001627231.1 predicted protein [Nematostella vectensis]